MWLSGTFSTWRAEGCKAEFAHQRSVCLLIFSSKEWITCFIFPCMVKQKFLWRFLKKSEGSQWPASALTFCPCMQQQWPSLQNIKGFFFLWTQEYHARTLTGTGSTAPIILEDYPKSIFAWPRKSSLPNGWKSADQCQNCAARRFVHPANRGALAIWWGSLSPECLSPGHIHSDCIPSPRRGGGRTTLMTGNKNKSRLTFVSGCVIRIVTKGRQHT